MADDRGGGTASSPSSSDAVTGRHGKPSPSPPLDGAFLLQLLQKPPPQPARPSASPAPLPPQHLDPAVAAIGPSHPFLTHDLRRPPPPGNFPDPFLFPSSPFSLPQGLPLPGLFPPPSGFLSLGDVDSAGSGRQGNHPFLPFDHQRLGFSAGGAYPLAASPPRSNLGQNIGHSSGGRVPLDQMVSSRKISGPRRQEDLSSLRTPPGFQKLQDGGTIEVDRGSASRSFSDGRSTRWKSQAERSSGSAHRHHQFHGERAKGSGFQRSKMMPGQRRPLDQARQQHRWEHSVATKEKRDENQKVQMVMGGQREEDTSHSLIADAMLSRDTPSRDSLSKHGNFPDEHEHRSRMFGSRFHAVNAPTSGIEVEDNEESDQDSEYEVLDEENTTGMQKLEIRDQNAKYSELCKPETNAVMLRFDPEVKNIVKRTSSSRPRDFRSDFFRGHHVSTQRMRIQRRAIKCRHDIDGWSPSFLSIYESLVPAEEEKAKQKQLLLSLQNLVNEEWPNAKLYLYGSCANTFGVSKSDIDVCLAINDHNLSKSDILLKLADILESGNLQNIQALTRARVPIVKLMDPVTGLSCDICVNNLLAVVNTKLLKDYAQIDERLRQLAFIVKHWARSRRVNETYQGTLSSYAYVLMCIHFLQLRRPAILPCLQAMDATYTVTVDNTECTYFDQVERLQAFGIRNKESIAQLLWAFFHYWAYHHDYTNDVISIRTGSIISKQAKDWTRRIGNDRHLICIEDPFDISHDLGRVVDKYSIKILREEFERAADILQYNPNPSITLFEPYISGSPQS